MQKTKLEPCPFCGGSAEILQFGNSKQSTIYACTECGCVLETSETFDHGRIWNTRKERVCDSSFKKYKRTGYAEMKPWTPGMNLDGVSISKEDYLSGSPKEGDMIARNPNNHDDMWLVAKKYFEENFEPYE